MKQLLTTLLTLAFVVVGVGEASAQTDVTGKYIKSADLSTTDGWTQSHFNSSKQGSTTNDGYAIEAYAGWGSLEVKNYSLTQEITLPAGNYQLVNYSFYREGEGYDVDAQTSRAYLKAGDKQVALKTLGSIVCAGYANSQQEGANVFSTMMYRNTLDFTLDTESTIEIGIVGTFEQIKSWCIVGSFQLFDMDKTPNAQDVTYLLTNPGFEYRDMSGWTLSENGAFGAQSNNEFGGKAGGYYAEKWQRTEALSDRSMTQSLTGLVNGNYRFSAYAFYGGTGAYLQAGDATTPVTANASGYYSVSAKVTDGTLTVGAGLKDGTSNWICFDRFKLEYIPDVISDDDAAEIIGQAEALEGQAMNAETRSTLVAAKSAFDSNKILANYSALQTAIANARVSVNAYASAKSALDGRAQLVASTNVYTSAAYQTYYADPKAKYDARTLTDGEANALTNPYSKSDWHSDVATNAFMGSAFGVTDYNAVPYANTWSVEGNNDGSNFKTPFYEYWVDASKTLGDKVLTATVTGLKAGQKYKFTADVRVMVSSAPATGITIDMNGGDAVMVTGNRVGSSTFYLDTYTVLGEADESGKANINFNVKNTNVSWLSFQNIKVEETTSEDVYNEALTTAQALLAESAYAQVTGEERTALQNAVNSTKPTTDEGLAEATSTLNANIATFKAALSSYVAFDEARKATDPQLPYASETTKSNFVNALDATPASAADAVAKTEAITKALRAYYESNAKAEGVEGAKAIEIAGDFTGATVAYPKVGEWTATQNGGNLQVLNNETWTNADGTAGQSYFDYYNGSANNQHGYLDVDLEPGKYLVTVRSRAQEGLETYFKAGDKTVDLQEVGSTGGVFGRGWNDAYVAFTANGTTRLEWYSTHTNGNHAGWAGFGNVRLVKIGNLDAVTLDEAATDAPLQNADFQTVTLNRPFVQGWNSVVLPFDATLDELGAIKAVAYAGTEGSVINFTAADALVANTPYLVYFEEAASSVVFAAKKVAPSATLTVADKADEPLYDLVGTYVAAATSPVKAGDYLVNATGIVKAKGGNVLKGFRAYLAAQSTEAAAKSMTMAIDGQVVTGIEAVRMRDALDGGAAYNIAGQRVGKGYKGIVIRGGKKMLEK